MILQDSSSKDSWKFNLPKLLWDYNQDCSLNKEIANFINISSYVYQFTFIIVTHVASYKVFKYALIICHVVQKSGGTAETGELIDAENVD